MDSINKNQPEKNTEHLDGAEARKKIRELVEKANTCFFCTNITTSKPITVRPMSVQKIDNNGVLWFPSAADSHKNEEIDRKAAVQLMFQGSKYEDFLTLYGTAEISTDKKKIDELWEPTLKTWFTEGKDDPRITVIKVTPSSGYYWDTKHGSAVALLKTMVGAAMGKTLDDSIEGKLKP